MRTSRLLYSIVLRKFSCTMTQSYPRYMTLRRSTELPVIGTEGLVPLRMRVLPTRFFDNNFFIFLLVLTIHLRFFAIKLQVRLKCDSAIFRSNLKTGIVSREKKNRMGSQRVLPLRPWESSGKSQLLKIKRCLPFSKAIKHHFQPIAKRNFKQCP